MPNWTAKVTGFAKNAQNQANIDATVEFKNSATSETITRVLTASNFTVASLTSQAESVIATLVARDTALSNLSAALTAAGGAYILATG